MYGQYIAYLFQSSDAIGFIGLGNMGGPMALNLIKANHKLIVFDIVEDCIKPVAAAGAQVIIHFG